MAAVYHINCDYRLMTDSLMDLTHETYVHAGSNGKREIDEAPVAMRVEANTVSTSRFMGTAPFWRVAWRENGMPDDTAVDRWQVYKFSLSSRVLIDVGVARAGRGGIDAVPSEKVSGMIGDVLAPETDSTMSCFRGIERSFCPKNNVLTEKLHGKRAGRIFRRKSRDARAAAVQPAEQPRPAPDDAGFRCGRPHSRLLLERMLNLEHESSPQRRSRS